MFKKTLIWLVVVCMFITGMPLTALAGAADGGDSIWVTPDGFGFLTGHTHEFKDTCTTNDKTLRTCECGYSYVKNEKKEHTPGAAVQENLTNATCSMAGKYESVVYCVDCGKELSRDTVSVDKLPHTEGNVVVENNEEATCGKDGSYDNVVYCTVCEAELSRETVTVPATGNHVYKTEVERVEATCTEDGYVINACSCGAEKTTVLEATGHNEVYHDAKAPTCTEIGWGAYVTCSNCDYTTYQQIAATGHSYVEQVTPPTCNDNGYTTHTCACGHTYTDGVVPAPGHTMGEWQVTVYPTCETTGTKVRVCENCDYTETEVVPATGHSYEATATPPTCTEDGYTVYKCACGHSYKDNFVDKLGHDYYTEVVNPTCEVDGYTLHTCNNCRDTYKDTIVPATGHNMGEWFIIDNPACGIVGNKRSECSECDYFEAEEIPALEHIEGVEILEVLKESCGNDGQYIKTVYCTLCNHTFSQETIIVPATGEHVYATEVEKVEATCTEDGYVIKACACGAEIKEEIVSEGHKHTAFEVVAPTCIDGGYTVYKCVCGDSYKYDFTNPTGHTYTSVVTEPTCTEIGFTTNTCHCGEWYLSDHTEALGHSEVIDQGYDATCTKDGLTAGKHCDRCKETLVGQTVIEAYGHNPGEAVKENEVAADCENAGSYDVVVYCLRCNAEISRTTVAVDALGHSYEAEVTEATCTTAGYTTYTCACGDTYTANEVGALGHNHVTVTGTPASCEGVGLTDGEYCDRCNTWLVEQEKIAPIGHKETTELVKEVLSTCTTAGYREYHTTCANGCGMVDANITEPLELLPHTVVADAAVAPTCTATGLTEGSHCSVCNTVIVAQTVVDALGHSEEAVLGFAATCTANGLTDGVKCSACGVTLVAQNVIPALGHNYVGNVCSNCGAAKVVEAPVVDNSNVDFGGSDGSTEDKFITVGGENNDELSEEEKQEIIDDTKDIVDEIVHNGALKDFTVGNLPEDVELVVEVKGVHVNYSSENEEITTLLEKLTYNVSPLDINNNKVENFEEGKGITFRLPLPKNLNNKNFVKVYHEGVYIGMYEVQNDNGNNYVEIYSENFSEYTLVLAESYAAMIGDEGYMTLADAIAAANAGDTITLVTDITISETITITTDKNIVLDLNGKTINVAWADESAGKHIYAFENKGALTITGNGTINARGIYNYGLITLENGTINAIDGNGGYAVKCYSGAKFVMNGGTVAAIYEDGDAPTAGYDATTVSVDAGAEFIMNGGVINNVSNYTFAIDNAGTVTIENGTVTSVHSTISNYGTLTINGGSFTCNGLEGITAHALVAWNGSETTINGGTFKGKSNYNGFNVDTEAGATVVIKGGEFLACHSGSLYGEGTIAVSGGKFYDDIADKYIADGYEQDENGNIVVAKVYVAEVDGEKYETLLGALAAAEAGDVVTLLGDLTLAAGDIDYYQNIKIPAGVTFDGGNFELVVMESQDSDYAVFWSDGAYTVQNISIKVMGRREANRSVLNFSKGGALKNVKIWAQVLDIGVNYDKPVNGMTLTVENCEISNVTYAFYCDPNASEIDVTIKNNVINSQRFGSMQHDEYIVGNTLTSTCTKGISLGATFTGTIIGNKFEGARALSVYGTQTISGNVILGKVELNNGAVADLSGNYWGGEAPTESQIVAESGTAVVDFTVDSYYATYEGGVLSDLVTLATPVAEVNGVQYNTLAEAIAAAQAGDTVIILVDEIVFEENAASIVINKAITIQGAGASETKLTFNSATSAFVIESSNVTIKDMTIAQGTKDNSFAISINKGAWDAPKIQYSNITISGITFVEGDYALCLIGESVVVDGCKFVSQDSNNIIIYSLNGESKITNNDFGVSKNAKKPVILWEGGADNATDLSGFIGGGTLTISGNTATDRGVFFQFTSWNKIKDLSLVITKNVVTGTTNKVIALYDHDGAIVAAGDEFASVTITENAFVNTTSGRPIIREYTGTVVIDASGNYLGSRNPSISELIVGTKITVDSYYATYEGGVLSDLVTLATPVAEVNGTKYETFAEAFAAAQSGDTITLLADVELTDILVIDAGKTLTINIGEYDITQTADGVNAIVNYGVLTINGTDGIITGNWNGIFNCATLTVNGVTIKGANNAIYNGDWDWDNWEPIYTANTTINGGSFIGTNYNGVYNTPGSTMTITGGTFAAPNWGICSDADAANVVVSGNYENTSILQATITGGSFDNCYLEVCKINGDVSFVNADVRYTTFKDGNICGTFANVVGPYLYGGTFTAEAWDSISSFNPTIYAGYKVVENGDGTYSIVTVPKYVFKVTSADTTKGTLGSTKYSYASGSGTVNGGFTVNVYEGSIVTFSVTAVTPATGYEFKGWFTNPEGTGEAWSTEMLLTNATYTVNEATTLYAVFAISEEYLEFVAAAKAWVADYDTTTAFTVDSKDEMAYLAYAVNTLGKTFSGKTVTLTVDLAYGEGETYTPVGTSAVAFAGTFDGGNNTISGVVLSGNYIGVFGKSSSTAIIKNLNIKDFTLSGQYAGGIVGQAAGRIESCTATNVNVSGWFAGCIVGHTHAMTVGDDGIFNVTVTGGSANSLKAGGIIGYANYLKLTNATVDGLTVSGNAGAIGGHIHVTDNVFTNIVVKNIIAGDTNTPALIGTTYSYGAILITGEGTNVDNSIQAIVATTQASDATLSIKGGTYSIDVTEYLADGYYLVNNGNGTYSVLDHLPVYVAEVNGTKYESLADAIAAANGSTVTLLSDVELTDTLTIPAGFEVTLELNGYTISQVKAQTGGYQMILNDGKLTIQDSVGGGKISYTDTVGGNFISNTITNRGTLILKSGTIENLSPAAVANVGFPYAIDTSIWGAATEVNVVIEGGTVTCANYSALRLRADSPTEAVNITITGGTINGRIEVQNPQSSMASAGKLTISGDAVVNKNNSSMAIMIFGGGGTGENMVVDISGGTINGSVGFSSYFGPVTGFNTEIISGGTFTSPIAEDWCAAGFMPVDNGDGTYGVDVDPTYGKVAMIGDTYYATLAEAFAAAQNGDTVKLISDVVLTEGITVSGKSITLDGNGFSISATADANLGYQAVYFIGDKNNEITIKDITFKDFVKSNVSAIILRLEGAKQFTLTDVYFDNCDVSKGTATDYSVMRVYDTNFTATNLNITNCKGGMLMDIGPSSNYFVGKIEIKDSKFENNTVLGTALIYTNLTKAENSYLAIDNTEFVNNVIGDANSSGAAGRGVIHLGSDSVITNCTFDGNEVYGSHANNVSYGINEYSGYNHVFTANTFRNNAAYQTNAKVGPVSGAAIMTVGSAVLENNIVEDNNKFYNRATVEDTFVEKEVASVGSYSDSYGKTTILSGTYNGKLVTYSEGQGFEVKGGTYNTAIPESFCAEGFVPADNGDGTYGVKVGKYVAEVGGTKYESLAEAFAAAADGDTLTLLADITSGEIIVINKAITLDGNGKTLTSTAGRAINVSGANGVTIKNLTIIASGERAINIIQNTTNVTIDNVTATAANYTINVASSAANAVVAIKNSTLNGLCTVNVAAKGAQVTVDNSTINCNDDNTTAGEAYAALSLNKEAIGGSIIATNCTVNVAAGSDSYKGRNSAEDGEVIINGSTDDVIVIVAVITYAGSDYYYGFATLADALEFAKAGDTITLIRDITTSAKIEITKSITLDGNGKTLTYTGSDRAIDIPNNASTKVNVTISNLTVNFTASYCQRGINYNDDGKLTLNNVTVNGTNVTYALNLPGSSDNAVVTIKDSSLTGHIALNVWGEYVLVNAENTAFTSVDNTDVENYSAIALNNDGTTIAEGSVINIVGGSITALDENGELSTAIRNATVVGEVNVSDTTEVVGNTKDVLVIVTYAGYSEFYSCYTFQDAIDQAIATNGIVTLIKNVAIDDIVTVDGSVAINLNGFTLDAEFVITNASAVFTAPEGLTVNTNVADYKVVYENGAYALVVRVYVAEIDGVKYESLQAAIDAAADGATVTIIADIAATERINIESKNLTLDLDGHKITTAQGYTDKYVFRIVNNLGVEKVVTIMNGTIEAEVNTAERALFIYCKDDSVEGEKLVLNLYDVTIKNTRTDGTKSAILAQRNVTINVNDGTVIDSNGTYSTVEMGYGAIMNVYDGVTVKHTSGTSANALNAALSAGSNGSVINVYGGTITSDMYSVYALPTGANIKLEGGTFNGDVMAHDAGNVVITGGTYNGNLVTSNGTMTVSGGIFSTPVAEELCAEGYIPVANSNGTYGVIERPIANIPGHGTLMNTNGTYIHFNIYSAYADESIVLKLYAGDVLIGICEMVNPAYLQYTGGNGTLTANFEITRQSSTWQTTWIGQNPDAAVVPTRVELYIDGVYFDDATMGFTAEEWAATEGVKTYVAQVGDVKYETLQDAYDAAEAGDTIELLSDVAIDGMLTILKSITIDGNGFKIVPADANASYSSAIMVGVNAATNLGISFKLVDATVTGFNALHGVIRAEGVDVEIENCVISGNKSTSTSHGIISPAYTTLVVKNTVFENNEGQMVISYNYNGDGSTDTLTVDGCTFKNNNCTTTAVIFYNCGGAATITNNVFDNNTVTDTSRASVIYFSAGNATVTGNKFYANNVSYATDRSAVVSLENNTTFKNNVFVDNVLFANANFCATALYKADNGSAAIDMSENYWGGNKPGVGDFASAKGAPITLNSYYTDEACTLLVELTFVAEVNGTKYESLAEALAAAADGDTVTLLENVTIDALIKLENAIVLDLNGNTVTASSKKAFEVYADVTIKNGKIVSANRCVDTREAVDLVLENVVLEATSTTYGNPQPLTIGGAENGTTVTMTGVTINAGCGYAIITFVETNLTATSSKLDGYSALYVKPGSDNSVFKFVSCEINATTGSNDVAENSFSVIAVRANNVTVSVDANSSIKATGTYCTALSLGSNYSGETEVTGANITVAGTITASTLLSKAPLNDNLVAVKSEYAAALAACGYTSEAIADGMVKVSGKAAVVIGDVAYATLNAALAAAQSGDTIKLVSDIDMSSEVVNILKKITLDLNGYTLKALAFAQFADGNIVDNGETKGLLAVPEGMFIANRGEYPMLPVWNEEATGYVLVAVKPQIKIDVIDEDSFEILLRPSVSGGGVSTNGLFKDGALDNGITFKIVIHFVKGGVVQGNEEVFTFSDNLVKTVYSSSNLGMLLTVNGATTAYDNYKIDLVIESTAGISYTYEVGSFANGEVTQ